MPNRQLVRFSKNVPYEKPFYVKGINKLAGLEQAPKDICKDKTIGTRKGTGLAINKRTNHISR